MATNPVGPRVGGRLAVHAAYTGLMPAQPPDPYRPLRQHLASQSGDELTLTFIELEDLLGMPLPDQAWQRAWWTNTVGVPQAHAWLSAGWRVRWVRRSAYGAAVTFARTQLPRAIMP